jgi:hypothetical protein
MVNEFYFSGKDNVPARIHKSPPFDPNELREIRTIIRNTLKSVLTLHAYLRLGLPRCLFFPGFLTFVYVFQILMSPDF